MLLQQKSDIKLNDFYRLPNLNIKIRKISSLSVFSPLSEILLIKANRILTSYENVCQPIADFVEGTSH